MRVSHSRVDCFKQCGYKFKLRYIDELQTYFNNDPTNPLVIGTALHTGIEKDIPTAIKEYYANYPVIEDSHIEEAIKLEQVIKKCKDILPKGLHEVKIEDPDKFIGFIDLLVPIGRDEEGNELFDIYDFKYSNNVENYLKSGQLHEYKYFFEKLNPTKHVRKLYFLFAPKVAIKRKRKNKTNKREETLPDFRKRLKVELDARKPRLVEVKYDPKKVETFLQNANDCVNAKTFDKNPTRLCDWCEFKRYCESNGKDDLEIMKLPSTQRRTIESSNYKKIWFYGLPFSGKTYLANQFDTPLMLNTDGNYKQVDAPIVRIVDEVTQEGRITKRKYAWEVFQDAVAELERGSEFKTIIVDLLEDVYDACRIKVCVDNGWNHESDDSFKAYDIVRSEFLRTLKRLLSLNYNIVLISHEDTSRDITKKSGDKVTAIKPNLQEKIALKVAGMIDIACRIVNDEGKRTIRFKSNEVEFGGGRLELKTKEIPCSYNELMKIYGEDKPKVELTDEQKVVNILDGGETKAYLNGERTFVPQNVEVETAVVEPPKRKPRTKPTEHEKKVEEFKEERAKQEYAKHEDEPYPQINPNTGEVMEMPEQRMEAPVRRRRRRVANDAPALYDGPSLDINPDDLPW